jgi:hypothetical protein
MEAVHMKYNETNTYNTEIDIKRQEIDNHLENKEYSRAFGILLDLIKSLNQHDKTKIWEYYENKVYSNQNNNNVFPLDPYFHSK